MTFGSVTDGSTSALSAEGDVSSAVDEVTATLSFRLSESSDIFSVTESSILAASTDIYITQSRAVDFDFTSLCSSTDSTSYSTDAHDALTSTTEVPVGMSTDSSELSITEYDSSSMTTVDVSSMGTLASSAMANTFIDSTHMGITTEVPFSTYDYVSEILTGVHDFASVTVTETDSETTAAVKMSYSTDGFTATSDKYTLSSISGKVSFNVAVNVSQLLLAQYGTVTFTHSPVVGTVSEILRSYSPETEAPVVSMQSSHTGTATDYTVKTEKDMSADATFALLDASESVFTSTNADITSHVVTTTLTSNVDIMFSSETQMVASTHDYENVSAATTSTMMDTLPGDF